MEQKFTGDIGQVAGRDVKSSSAQSSVSVHIHNGPKSGYISDRQRSAIARKVYLIQAETQTDKLMVYRRLMTVFKFHSMDEMPRDVYQRVTAYLDAWLRNGTTEQAPSKATPTDPAQLAEIPRASGQGTQAATTSSQTAVPQELSYTQAAAATVPVKRVPWRVVAVACLLIFAAIAAIAYTVASYSQVSTQAPAIAVAPRCEYAGDHYSIGSVVMQAGLRQQCVATGEHAAAWQKVTGARGR